MTSTYVATGIHRNRLQGSVPIPLDIDLDLDLDLDLDSLVP